MALTIPQIELLARINRRAHMVRKGKPVHPDTGAEVARKRTLEVLITAGLLHTQALENLFGESEEYAFITAKGRNFLTKRNWSISYWGQILEGTVTEVYKYIKQVRKRNPNESIEIFYTCPDTGVKCRTTLTSLEKIHGIHR